MVLSRNKSLELDIFTTLQETLANCLERNIDEDLARDLIKNSSALEVLLQEALTRENLTKVLAKLGKRPGLPRKEFVIDADQLPRIPDDMNLHERGAEHRKMGSAIKLEMRGGRLYVNGVVVERYLSPHQDGKKGHKLRGELKDKRTLNACFLDALTSHQEFIPEEWKAGYTYFWGTIFCNGNGQHYVGVLFWLNGKWRWSYEYLGHNWSARGHAACLVDLPSVA